MSARASLSELHQLIRRIEARHRPGRPPGGPRSLEDLLEGNLEETEHGPILLVRRRFPADHAHGSQPLRAAREVGAASLGLLARPPGPPPAPGRLLFLDTETTGLAGGTGTYAFLVGVGCFDGAEFEIRQYFMRDLDEEPALLAALERVFAGFEGVVTYNGSGFDLPLLETRFVLGRRAWPGLAFHLDLLAPARRLWRARLGDCRLATVEQQVLGFRRANDLPGALIPSVYFDYLRRRSTGELPRVFEHNRHDILALAALTGWVAAAVDRAPEADLHPEELLGLGRLLEAHDPERGWGCYRLALERGLASPARERALLRLAGREKRLARWEAARALWEEAARGRRGFDPRPWEEIAKLHEHRRRDLPAALAAVGEALALARRPDVPERVRQAFEHRLRRLRRRLAGSPAPAPPATRPEVEPGGRRPRSSN